MKSELVKYLEKIAATSVQDNEDFNVYDYCGGNYDDAFALGHDEGEANLARYILENFCNNA